MEDKTFELLEKMYVEFSEFRKETNVRFDNVENRLGNVENRLGNVENRLGNVENRLDSVEGHITRIENDHGKKLDALFDGYMQLAEGQQEIKLQLNELFSRVEKHDTQITLLKGNAKAVK